MSLPFAILASARLLLLCLYNLNDHSEVAAGRDFEDILGAPPVEIIAHCMNAHRIFAQIPRESTRVRGLMEEVELVTAIVKRDTRPNILELMLSEKFITHTVMVLRDAVRLGYVSFLDGEQVRGNWVNRVFLLWRDLTGRCIAVKNAAIPLIDSRVAEEMIKAGAMLYFEKFSWSGVGYIMGTPLPI